MGRVKSRKGIDPLIPLFAAFLFTAGLNLLPADCFPPPPDRKDPTWVPVANGAAGTWMDGTLICLENTAFIPEESSATPAVIPAGTEVFTTFSSSHLVVWKNSHGETALLFRLLYNDTYGYARLDKFISHLTPESSPRYGLLWQPLPEKPGYPLYKVYLAEFTGGSALRLLLLEDTAPQILNVEDIDGNGLDDILVYCSFSSREGSGTGMRIIGHFPKGYGLLFSEIREQPGFGHDGSFLYRDTDGDGIRETLLAEWLLDEPGENDGEYRRLSRVYNLSADGHRYRLTSEKESDCGYEEYFDKFADEADERDILHTYGIN